MLVRSPQRAYHTWNIDSTRWTHYRPRPSDIIIGTHPKCGTTWMQQIVSLLVFQCTEAKPVWRISPWMERRFPYSTEYVTCEIEAQPHRRFLKSHVPFDGIPLFDDVRYIHVARDARDAFMSLHNHCLAFTDDALAALDRAGLAHEAIARPFPRVSHDPRRFFRSWLTQSAVPGHSDGSPFVSFFEIERTYWEQRHRPNLLLVHYNDLKADLSGEMRRIAEFLEIHVDPAIWDELVAAASFESMRRIGDTLLWEGKDTFSGGGERFFYKGANGRWRDVLNEGDMALYHDKVRARLSPSCAEWVANGRLEVGDPRLAA